jgi:protein phosphatase PTC7
VLKNSADLLPIDERRLRRPLSGQDSFFVSNVADTGAVAFGVLDGVGGWVESGVDPSDFSHSLAEYMSSIASIYPKSIEGATLPLRPRDLLDWGYTRVIKDKAIFAGGSTATIATVLPNGSVEVAK